jgi:hypothetical protein
MSDENTEHSRRTDMRNVSRQTASRYVSESNSSHEKSRPPFSSRASMISCLSFSWTSGWRAIRCRIRVIALEVGSMAAKIKVLERI